MTMRRYLLFRPSLRVLHSGQRLSSSLLKRSDFPKGRFKLAESLFVVESSSLITESHKTIGHGCMDPF